MFLTVPWGILILSKIARGMFCIIKSNYITSCNSFLINREKLGDYLKWTDFSSVASLVLRTIHIARSELNTDRETSYASSSKWRLCTDSNKFAVFGWGPRLPRPFISSVYSWLSIREGCEGLSQN